MAGQDEDNSNQNDITENYEIEPTEQSDDEIDIEDVEGKLHAKCCYVTGTYW